MGALGEFYVLFLVRGCGLPLTDGVGLWRVSIRHLGMLGGSIGRM